MRYGKSSLLSGLQELRQRRNRSDAFPLYPQHAMASTTTILELAEEHRQNIFRNEIYYRSCLL
jgi:ferrochelatase